MKNQDQVVLSASVAGQDVTDVDTKTKGPMIAKSGPRSDSSPESYTKVTRYRAPALEKGLDVIELLAAEKSPLNLSAISQRLGRSAGELFRMLQVLEFKGFITLADDGK